VDGRPRGNALQGADRTGVFVLWESEKLRWTGRRRCRSVKAGGRLIDVMPTILESARPQDPGKGPGGQSPGRVRPKGPAISAAAVP